MKIDIEEMVLEEDNYPFELDGEDPDGEADDDEQAYFPF